MKKLCFIIMSTVVVCYTTVSAADFSQSGASAYFDTAEQLYELREYEYAAKGYLRFIGKYPDSSLRPAALYRLGRCYQAIRKYSRAVDAYEDILHSYPKGYWANRARLARLEVLAIWQTGRSSYFSYL